MNPGDMEGRHRRRLHEMHDWLLWDREMNESPEWRRMVRIFEWWNPA